MDRLSFDELLLLEAMEKKSRGIANWDESLQRAVESVKMYPGKEPPFFASLLQSEKS